MILQDVWKTQLTFSTHKPIVIEPVAEHLTSDAGMLLFGELDQQLDFTCEFAAQLDDPRQDPDHPFLQMSRSRRTSRPSLSPATTIGCFFLVGRGSTSDCWQT